MAADRSHIVVGVDGSPAAHAAVRWAAGQARDAVHELVLLHAREEGRPTPFPAIPRGGADPEEELTPYRDELGDTSTLAVRRRVVAAPPARALIEASREAEMIVLGRAAGRLRSWPGATSLTRRVLAGASCPVVLVPDHAEADR